MHAGSPCDAVSWAPCDRPHRQPRSDAAAQQGIACSTNRETLPSTTPRGKQAVKDVFGRHGHALPRPNRK